MWDFNKFVEDVERLIQEGDKPISAAEFSKEAGVHTKTFRAKVKAGELPDGVRFGHCRYWKPSDFLAKFKAMYPTLFPSERRR